jgi:hypothetical protein
MVEAGEDLATGRGDQHRLFLPNAVAAVARHALSAGSGASPGTG